MMMTEIAAAEERILVVNAQGARLGGCFLDMSHKRLYFIQEQTVTAGKSLEEPIDSLLTVFQPSKVVVSARLEEGAHGLISREAAAMNYTVDVLSSKAFSSAASSGILDDLASDSTAHVKFDALLPEIKYDRQWVLSRHSLQPLQSTVEANSDPERRTVFIECVQDIQVHVPADHLYVDRGTLRDLNIFDIDEDERTSNCCMFDLLNRTGSTLGQKMLESWFRAPLANIDMINERLNVVDALASPQNSRHFDELNRCCKNLPNVNQVLSSIQTGKPSLSPWVNLSLFLQRAVEIHATVSLMSKDDNYGDAQPFFLELTQCINVTYLLTLHSQISNIIDFESSRDWKRVYVRDGYNEELDAFKIKYNELEELLRHLAYELSLRHRQIPESALNMVYIPQLGYLISLTMDVDMGSHCIPETWDEIFRTTTNVYFKDPTTEEMDEEHGDIYQMILDLEIEILYGLQEHVTTFQRSLSRVSLLISELDAFSSLAQGALSLNLTRPLFCNDPILEIDQGRNIIVEQQVGSYIANNTTLTNEIAVITGANSSGKSAYLAQIGMISYLAHMGSFVPAKGCKIGTMDKILTKITSNESIMRNESFFYGDLIRVSKAIQMRSERSLVLMDEFGRGTDSVGGAALLGAIIEGLAGVSRCVVTTHFHELFKSGVLKAKVVHWHMDVLFTQRISNGVEELTYLFKLEPGVAENSFGIQCAEICGIPRHVIERAYQIMELENGLREESYHDDGLRLSKLITREFLLWDLDKPIPSDEIQSKLDEILKQAD